MTVRVVLEKKKKKKKKKKAADWTIALKGQGGLAPQRVSLHFADFIVRYD